jgi:hypothetical protein
MGLVKDDNGIFGHLFGNLFRHFRIQQIMERVDDYIYKRHLTEAGECAVLKSSLRSTYHSSNREIRTRAIVSAVLEDIS